MPDKFKNIEKLNIMYVDVDGEVFQLMEYDVVGDRVLLVSNNNDSGGWKDLGDFNQDTQSKVKDSK